MSFCCHFDLKMTCAQLPEHVTEFVMASVTDIRYVWVFFTARGLGVDNYTSSFTTEIMHVWLVLAHIALGVENHSDLLFLL
jgi:hypothetical protein